MSAGKKGSSPLAAAGLNLARIGARFVDAVNDAGGNDEIAMLALNSQSMRDAIGQTIITPRWEVVSDAKKEREFLESGTFVCTIYGFQYLQMFGPQPPGVPQRMTSGMMYRLRGALIGNQKSIEQVWRETDRIRPVVSLPEELPLEVALLMRMKIKPEELGFSAAVINSPFLSCDGVFYPVLQNSGTLGCWPKSELLDFAKLPRDIAFVFLEEKLQLSVS